MSGNAAVTVGEVELKNPVVCGSGEHVGTPEGLRAAIDSGAAAVVGKSANESDDGRRQASAAAWKLFDHQWREVRAANGSECVSLFNRSGLVPQPWDDWLDTLAAADSYASGRGAYVIASVIPGDPSELGRLVSEVEAAGLRWVELNLSAPHAGEALPGVIAQASTAELVSQLTSRARVATTLPLTVKLTAESADVVALARAALATGADSVAISGRHLAFLPDPETRRPALGTFGAIGGPWGLPLTLRWIAKSRLALGVDVPLIGSNGARGGLDVVRFLLAGAAAVQIATSVIIEGFVALTRVLDELAEYLATHRVAVADIVGEAADAVLTYQDHEVSA